MAHKKGQGSSRNGRDSSAQYRGVKVFGGQQVSAGSILVRQVGSTFHAGQNVGVGKDYTLWARVDGVVRYEREGKKRQRISVYPLDTADVTAEATA
jgi:large subunit ribosomal protein L27